MSNSLAEKAAEAKAATRAKAEANVAAWVKEKAEAKAAARAKAEANVAAWKKEEAEARKAVKEEAEAWAKASAAWEKEAEVEWAKEAEVAWAKAAKTEANAKSMQWQPMTNWAVFEDRREYLIYFANDKARYRTEVAIYLQGDAKPFACESNDYDRKMITYYAPIIQPDEQ